MRGRKESVRVAVIGAGVSGVAVAAKLVDAGFDDVTVFEKSDAAGGTWFDNVYPGCAVDVPSEVYSFSFYPYAWKRSHATQSELREYLDEVIDHLSIRNKFRFGARVERAIWDPVAAEFAIELAGGEVQRANLLVCCLGMLNDPKYPDLAGMSDFRGPMFHTARWEDHDMGGKRVALVGTGSSAVQIAPELADVVEHLYIFQREPGWIIPKDVREFTPEERRLDFKGRLMRKWRRYRGFMRSAERLSVRQVGTPAHEAMTAAAIAHIEASIEDPDLRRIVTPTYPLGCKRIVRDSLFYRSLTRDNVTLVPQAVSRFTETGLIDADGVERQVDAVVLATGFKTTQYLSQVDVIGDGGISIHDHWAGEPAAFYGITVDGFPNLFMAYGPNTNGGASIIAQSERQAEVIVKVAKRMARYGYRVVDTPTEKLREFVEWVDQRNESTANSRRAGCHNYYMSPGGRNVTQWPNSHMSYWWRTRWVPRRLKYSR